MSTEFFAELKRRRVFRVAAIYAVVAWLIIQVAATVQPFLNLPPWVVTLVIVLVALGLPVTLVLGWAFDITPEGIRRDSSAPQAIQTRRQMSIAAGILLLICLAAGTLLFYLRRLPDDAAKAIAVLPFTSLSADRNNEYFADGIHEQVLDQLTQIPDLHVVENFTRGSGELVPILLELRPDFFDQLSLTAGVDSVDYYLISGLVHQRNGRIAEARAAFEKDRLIGEAKRRNAAADSSSFSVNQATWLHADLALAYAALGRHNDAVAAALHAVNRVPPRADRYLLFNVSWVLARVQMTAGRVDDAIDVLEGVVAEATAPVYGFTTQRLRVDPMFAPLRASPRFQKLVSTP